MSTILLNYMRTIWNWKSFEMNEKYELEVQYTIMYEKVFNYPWVKIHLWLIAFEIIWGTMSMCKDREGIWWIEFRHWYSTRTALYPWIQSNFDVLMIDFLWKLNCWWQKKVFFGVNPKNFPKSESLPSIF